MKKSVIGGKHLALSLALIILRGLCVPSHVVRASFLVPLEYVSEMH